MFTRYPEISWHNIPRVDIYDEVEDFKSIPVIVIAKGFTTPS